MSWIERAKVGQKIICVDTVSRIVTGRIGTLTLGAVYSIRWIGIYRGAICVRLNEIVRPCGLDVGLEDTPYYADRFRPVRDTTLQVEAIIRAALNIPEHV